MGKALYRKYRSRSLSEVLGQDHITTTLGNALAAGKIAHAYLLTGPRGVGKTSIARILAHEINELPYSEEPHFDIIEIDAASNNGVEDVRDLRDKIMSAPASAKYKVFIIDEVHMLSKAAFNALLKTLEEPPEHVVFILATTEAHKLPETIISRTQRYSFRPAPLEVVISHLRNISQKEHITIDDDALELIAEHGDGSFRDSVSLLDQASSTHEHITRAHIEQLLGHAPSESIDQIENAFENQNTQAALSALRELNNQGYEAAMIALQLGRSVRSKIALDGHDMSRLELLRDLLDVPPAHNPRAMLEILVIKHSNKTNPGQNATELQKPSQVKTTEKTKQQTDKFGSMNHEGNPVAKTSPKNNSEMKPDEAAAPVTEESSKDSENAQVDASDTFDSAKGLWQSVLNELKQTHNTLYGIARMAQPSLDGDKLTLELNFAFHQKRLNEPRNRAILTQLVETKRGQKTEIVCAKVHIKKPSSTQPDTVATISNIFGGAELLES